MGEYLAAPALLDEPAVQQSFLSYFNTGSASALALAAAASLVAALIAAQIALAAAASWQGALTAPVERLAVCLVRAIKGLAR